MGRGYGGGARFEWTLRVAGAEPAEMAWEEATEGGARFEWMLRGGGYGAESRGAAELA